MSGQGLSSNHPDSAVLSLSLTRKALRSERVVSCLCALQTRAHDGRQVALVSQGAPPQRPPSFNLGFRAYPELGPESPATSDGGDIWCLTWARATGRWGSGETSRTETNRQLIPELTPHLPGPQTTGPAHPQGQPRRFLPLPRRLSVQSTFRHRSGCKNTSRQLVAALLHYLKRDPRLRETVGAKAWPDILEVLWVFWGNRWPGSSPFHYPHYPTRFRVGRPWAKASVFPLAK